MEAAPCRLAQSQQPALVAADVPVLARFRLSAYLCKVGSCDHTALHAGGVIRKWHEELAKSISGPAW
jgi:hypothetical protein